MTLQEIKDLIIEEQREKLEEDLHGLVIYDYITRKDMQEYLEDFDYWSETANIGDTYYAQGFEYSLEMKFKLKIWNNEEQRNTGEPIYMTPIYSSNDLEMIKRECEKYDIEATGCIEIFLVGEDEPVLHYENETWSEVNNIIEEIER